MKLPVSPARLARLLLARGEGAPQRVDPVLPNTWRIETATSRHLLRLPVALPGRLGEDQELAAMQVGTRAGLPGIPDSYAALGREALGVPAALASDLAGRSGVALLGSSPGLGPTVWRRLGEVAAQMAETTAAEPALIGTPSGFLAHRAVWSEAWAAEVALWRRTCQDRSVDPDGIVSALEALALRSVSDPPSASLVHRDLSPRCTLWSETGALTGVMGWELALVGDPLLEWASVVAMAPSPALTAFAAGYGGLPEDTETLTSYVAARCLAELAVAALPTHLGPLGAGRARRVQVAVERAERVLAGGFVVARLSGASEVIGANEDAVRMRQILERLRWLPVPTSDELAMLAAAFVVDGAGLLEAVTPPIAPLLAEPIADRSAWRRRLVEDLIARDGGERAASALAWRALHAIEQLGGRISDSVLRGLETAVRGRAGRGGQHMATARLSGAVIGLALARSEGCATAALEEDCLEAWDVLSPLTASEAALPPFQVDGWAPRDRTTGLLPVVHRALAAGGQPVPAGAVWEVLSR